MSWYHTVGKAVAGTASVAGIITAAPVFGAIGTITAAGFAVCRYLTECPNRSNGTAGDFSACGRGGAIHPAQRAQAGAAVCVSTEDSTPASAAGNNAFRSRSSLGTAEQN